MKRIVVNGASEQAVELALAEKKAGNDVILVDYRQVAGGNEGAAGIEWEMVGESEILRPLGAYKKKLLAKVHQAEIPFLMASYFGGFISDASGKRAGIVLANSWGTQILPADEFVDMEGTWFYTEEAPKLATLRYVFVISNVKAIPYKIFPLPKELGVMNNQCRFHLSMRPNALSVEFFVQKELTKKEIQNIQTQNPMMAKKAVEIVDYLTSTGLVWFEGICLQERMYHETSLVDADVFTNNKISLSGSFLAEEIESYRLEYQLGKTISLKGAMATLWEEMKAEGLVQFRFPIPTLAEGLMTDVFVAGAGTSGTTSAMALEDRNVDYLVCDPLGVVGGTKTVGGVTGYWHGYKGGINPKADRTYYPYYPFNPEKRFLPNTFLCGARKEAGEKYQVSRVLLCNGSGFFTMDAKVLIDATGDGTLAYLLGAPYELGDPENGIVQTYSMWGENWWHCNVHHDKQFVGDYDMLQTDSYQDFLRCLYLSERENSDLDFSGFLSGRESRRIVGDYVLTMEDVVRETIHEDAVCVSQTRHDTHGVPTSDVDLMGLLEGDHRARIPYRCYVVRDFANLFITAKSFSGTRDGNAIPRMLADLGNAGYAVGTAACMAVKDWEKIGKNIRNIDIKKLQQELLELQILPEWTFERTELPAPRAVAYYDKLAAGEITSDPEALLKRIEQAEAGGEPYYGNVPGYKDCQYGYDRSDAWKVKNYNELYLIARAVLKEPDKRYQVALETLLEKPYISGYRTIQNHPEEGCPAVIHGISPVVCSVLELSLAAAAFKCGSLRGKKQVEGYLADDRKVLRDYAKKILAGK